MLQSVSIFTLLIRKYEFEISFVVDSSINMLHNMLLWKTLQKRSGGAFNVCRYLVSICTRSGFLADSVTDLVAVADRSRGGPARAIRTPPGAKRCSTCAKRSGDRMPSLCFAGRWIWVWGQGWSAGGVCVRGGSGGGQRVKGAGSELLFEVWGGVCWEADVCVWLYVFLVRARCFLAWHTFSRITPALNFVRVTISRSVR